MSSDLGRSLGDICGAVRQAAPADRVAGSLPDLVVSPATTSELSAIVRRLTEGGHTLAVVGAGTALAFGHSPRPIEVVVSTSRLDRILEHSPGDLHVSVEAGVRLSTLQKQLGADRQRLSLDPPDDGTVGGIVASNGTGPLRHRFGGPRDLLIGVTLVLADGTLARAGGKVVKNVAGYDLCKLMTGSFGTLAVIAAATLRVHPLPRASAALRHPVESPAEVGELIRGYAREKVEPSAIELTYDLAAGAGAVEATLEGTPEGVAARLDRVRTALGGAAPEDDKAADASGADDFVVGLAVPPAAVTEVLTALATSGLPGRVTGRVGLGVLELTLPGAGIDGQAGTPGPVAAVGVARRLAEAHQGSAIVARVADDLRPHLDLWGPVRGLDIMRRIKEQFDPTGTFVPGRFVGGI